MTTGGPWSPPAAGEGEGEGETTALTCGSLERPGREPPGVRGRDAGAREWEERLAHRDAEEEGLQEDSQPLPE